MHSLSFSRKVLNLLNLLLQILTISATMLLLCTSGRLEVNFVEILHTFILSVLASVVGYYICKWLEREK